MYIKAILAILRMSRKRKLPDLDPRQHNELRTIDLECALAVAGFAGIETRDKRGNLSPEVWVRHSDKLTVGQLLEAGDLKQLLLEQMRQQLSSQKDMLQEVDDHEVSIKWILDFSKAWEEHYRQTIFRNFDISQKINTAMHDGFYEVRMLLEETVLSPSFLQKNIRAVIEANDANENPYTLLSLEEAIVRIYFRHPAIAGIMRRVAGKILQKKEVCNRAGIYSARVQRNDITEECSKAILDLEEMLEFQTPDLIEMMQDLQDPNTLMYYIVDHRGSQPSDDYE